MKYLLVTYQWRILTRPSVAPFGCPVTLRCLYDIPAGRRIDIKLELDIVSIRDVQFAERTRVSDGVLYINRHELQELLRQDKRFSKVDIELAHV